MKITDVRLGIISVPLRVPFKTALRTVNSVEDVVVEIHTDCGKVGYGEAPPTGAITTARMTEQAYTDALYERTMQMLMLFGRSVQSELDAVSDVSFSILADNVLQEKLSEVARRQSSGIAALETKEEINNRIINLSVFRSKITSLRLRDNDGRFFNQTLTTTTVPSELFDRYEQDVRAARGRAIWVPDETAPGSLFLFRDVREIKDLTLNSIAMLGMRVSTERLVAACVEPLLQMNMPLLCAIDFKWRPLRATRRPVSRSF